MVRSEVIRYWQENALDHIRPERGNDLPEGPTILETLRSLCPGQVLEFGCGRGRLAGFFDPDEYLGVDICKAAIDVAEADWPSYQFRLIEPFEKLPEADTVLAYTVLQHVTDDELPKVIDQIKAPRVVIAEIMEPQRKVTNMPPSINRDVNEYVQFFPDYNGYAMRIRNLCYDDALTTILVLCKSFR